MALRMIIADNLIRFMRTARDELRTASGLGKASGVGRRTVDRLRNPQNYPDKAPTLATLVRIAEALEKDVWELLLPKRQPMLQSVSTKELNPISAGQTSARTDKRTRRN